MVRASRGTFRCVDCGRPLEVNEALVCSHCDAQELAELRALLAPEPMREASPRTS
jgi:NMD protein affecting ribosome stability and mRNA decay